MTFMPLPSARATLSLTVIAGGLTLAQATSAEPAQGLRLDSPEHCADQAQLEQRMVLKRAPRGVNHAVLRIVKTQDGYLSTFSLEQDGTHLSDQQQTKTCAAALAWGAFNWNNIVEELPAASEPPPKLTPFLSVALGAGSLLGFGSATHNADADLGLNAHISAELAHVRLGISGSTFATRSTTNQLDRNVDTERQRVGLQLCGVSGSPNDRLRFGFCGLGNVNFLQFGVADPAVDSEKGKARWLDVGAALLGSVKLPLGLFLEARVAAGISPAPPRLEGAHGNPPNVAYVLEPMLMLGYTVEAIPRTQNQSASSSASTRVLFGQVVRQ